MLKTLEKINVLKIVDIQANKQKNERASEQASEQTNKQQ